MQSKCTDEGTHGQTVSNDWTGMIPEDNDGMVLHMTANLVGALQDVQQCKV